MTVIRCTAKLLKLVSGSPTTRSMEPHPTDWYANLLWLDGRKCLLMAHSSTLFAVFEPEIAKAKVIPLGRFALSLIERELTAEGLPQDTFGPMAASDLVIGRTCSRSVLGTMTDMRYQIEAAVYQSGGLQRLDLAGLNRSLRRIPFGAVKYARAIDLARQVVGSEVSTKSSRAVATAERPRDRINEVLQEFLAARRKTIRARNHRNYEAIIEFFRRSLNGYAYESLSTFERKRFQEAFDAGDEDAYCELFGADKIPGEVGSFLGDFMVRKVIAPSSVIAAAGPVIADLLDWLVTEGLVKAEDLVDARERAVTTGSDLPKAERLARLLYGLAERSTLDAHSLADDDYIEDYLTISRVEPGVLWFEGGVGPLVVGETASRMAEPGWSINIVMGRQGGRWHVLEVGNVYPN
ncbi:MAG TPA: hypothetical protein VND96_01810 [Candidatus Micrarchaeaceae archaeon]|nr:hypothetical protein [Candidatus Micrarchaeaceae archaeon]